MADNSNVRLSKEFESKPSPKRDFEGAIVDRKPPHTTSAQSSSLIDAARAAGLDIKPGLTPGLTSDPMSSISALLAAAQATGGHMPMPPASSSPRNAPEASSVPKPVTSSTASSASKAGPSASSQQGLDLSNPQGATMANVNVGNIIIGQENQF